MLNIRPNEISADDTIISQMAALERRGRLAWVQLGMLLRQQKKALGHHNFGPWLKANESALGFCERTAQHRMEMVDLNPQIVADLEKGLPVDTTTPIRTPWDKLSMPKRDKTKILVPRLYDRNALSQFICGDALAILRTMLDKSVGMCLTSPPYFGLRDYDEPDQIGLEETPGAYIAKLVAVFREVKRVLADDGTLWIIIGDSYASCRDSKQVPQSIGSDTSYQGHIGASNRNPEMLRAAGLKHKDLIGIPFRLAFALQADGWWWRDTIIWHKPNVLPESVTDRTTKCHEHILMFSKQQHYFYDHEAIREPAVWDTVGTRTVKRSLQQTENNKCLPDERKKGIRIIHPNGDHSDGQQSPRVINGDGKRNCRSVWTIPAKPLPEAHFATFPPELCERAIKAGSAKGCVVLDPFVGTGTTALVARQLGRNYIGIDLNAEYIEMATRRLKE